MSQSPSYLDVMRDRLAEAGLKARGLPAAPRRAPDPPQPPAPVKPDEYTLEEAAHRCQVSVKTIQRWRIPRFKKGKIVRIPRAELEKFLAAHTSLPQDGTLSPGGPQ